MNKTAPFLALIVVAVLMLACASLQRPPEQVPSQPLPTEPSTAAPATVEPPTAPPATTPVPSAMQFIAYVSNDQLLVTNITGGTLGGTTQYTVQGQSDKVMDVNWSPDGQFVAFVSSAGSEPHIMYIYAEGASTPTNLGAGSAPAWPPDSKSIAYIGGTYPDENLFLTGIDNPQPKQLTFEKNHAWGRPAFTPDGQSLIVSTADRFDMGAQGNTSFTFERLALDGSGTRTALPGATPLEGVRLPYDVHFSRDGSRFAFSTSAHVSACGAPSQYYVSDLAGTRQELTSPSLQSVLDPSKELYYQGLNYAWMPAGDAIVAAGVVADCDPNSPTMGRSVAGPQMSLLRLDGSEGFVIPGMFYSISVDRTGKMVAATQYLSPPDLTGSVEVYSADTGQLIMKVGPGDNPQLQP